MKKLLLASAATVAFSVSAVAAGPATVTRPAVGPSFYCAAPAVANQGSIDRSLWYDPGYVDGRPPAFALHASEPQRVGADMKKFVLGAVVVLALGGPALQAPTNAKGPLPSDPVGPSRTGCCGPTATLKQ
jgi:hypothetical protein